MTDKEHPRQEIFDKISNYIHWEYYVWGNNDFKCMFCGESEQPMLSFISNDYGDYVCMSCLQDATMMVKNMLDCSHEMKVLAEGVLKNEEYTEQVKNCPKCGVNKRMVVKTDDIVPAS